MKELLLLISHQDFTLSIVGPKPMRNSYALSKINNTQFYTVSYPSLLDAVDVDNNASFCEIKSMGLPSSSQPEIDYKNVEEGKPLPLFFEHIDYNILLNYTTPERIDIWHESSSLIENLSEFSGKIISGNINFHNNVGETIFLIKKNNVALLSLKFIVYSTKLNFFSQRVTMLREVQQVHNSILYEIFKPTKDNASTLNEKISGIEWLTLFYQFSDSILKLVKRIENKSHSKLFTKSEVKPINKLRGSNKNFIKQVQKHGIESVYQKGKVWSDKKNITNDTYENRYIKFLLYQIVRTGKKWIKYVLEKDVSRGNTIKESNYFKTLASNVQFIERHLKNSFWRSIKIQNKVLENRGNFGFHPEFIKAEHFARKLKRGLLYDISGTERIYVLSMERLYELWTYVKIAEIISILTKRETSGVKLKTKTNEFRTSILMGIQSRVIINENLSIQTNRLFTKATLPYRVPIVNQKPDIIFELQNKNQLIIFDAKYKVNIWMKIDSENFQALTNKDLITKSIEGQVVIVLPNDEDINAIHRYKDAIYLNEEANYKHVVIKGYILFPGLINNESLNDSKTSSKNFGIAYLPFTPGEKDLEWYSESSFKFERLIEYPYKEDIRGVAEELNNILVQETE